jgi:hypothetical protein
LTGKLACGSYTGNGANDRIISTPFQPKFVVVLRPEGTNSTGAFKCDTMPAKLTLLFDNSSDVVDSGYVLACFADHFTVDNQPHGNLMGMGYHWIALG